LESLEKRLFPFARFGRMTYVKVSATGSRPDFSMIVCSCNVISDREIRSVIDSAPARPATANQVYGCLGCSPQCGRCARTIRKIMDQALAGCGADCACHPDR
jgi:bacterioferritin-associated ferredoxin